MNWKKNLNAVNQFTTGTEIYGEGESVYSIALVLKGRVLIHNKGVKYIVQSGCFLGVSDLYQGSYQSTYTALDDGMVYIFSANHRDDLDNVLTMNKDYKGLMVAYLYRMIKEIDQIHHEMVKHSIGLYSFIKEYYTYYIETSKRLGYQTILSNRLNELENPENELELERDRIDYYTECADLPLDVVKGFYSYSNNITLYQAEDQSRIINGQYDALRSLSDHLTNMVECLIDHSTDNLFYLYTSLAMEMQKASGNHDAMIEICDIIIEKINELENFYEKKVGRTLSINRKSMEEIYHILLTGTKGQAINLETAIRYSGEDTERALEEMRDSFRKLLDYGQVEGTEAQTMVEVMSNFINLKDRMSSEDNARKVRKKLTELYYVLYKKVFIRAYRDTNAPRIVDMFLQYGYADEKLLPKERLLELYFLHEPKMADMKLSIYNIREWLTLIYEGKKQPSKNEFDQEYQDMLISMKSHGRYTESELSDWATNPEKKLDYEIQNMFRYNNKTTNGQISIFVPVLHKDMLINSFEKALVLKVRVQEAIEKIESIDYSIFCREVLYTNPAKKINKEYIIKKVYPDIILMPTVGNSGIMWQEISGKKRDSAGRFLLPSFYEGNLTSVLVKLFGRFRWEMCRTIEGTGWNDIKIKSLTSEYSDYLQFYRKNRELSEEKKEKIKLQMQRARSSREVFAIDYEQWINYEAIGAIKLNKLVREMMATYCPFAKPIRDQLIMQPLFEEAMARYHRDKLKKIKEIESRYRALQKDKVELTQDMSDTLDYYKDN